MDRGHADPVAQREIDRLRGSLGDVAGLLGPDGHATACGVNYRWPFSWSHCQCWQGQVRSRLPVELRPDVRLVT